MSELSFWLLGMLAFAVPTVGLVHARRRFELDSLWYGLAFVGGLAAIVALIGRDVAFRLWSSVVEVPATPDALFSSWQGLVFFPLAAGFITEIAKSYGVMLFHTQLTRSRWPLFGASVGAGTGLLEAFMLLAATAWMLLIGQVDASWTMSWMPIRLLFSVPFHAGLCALTMYWAAHGKRPLGWLISGSLHGLVLFALQWMQFRQGVESAWLGALVYAVGVALVASVLWGLVKRVGHAI